MGVSFKREATMRFFQEIAFLLLPLLVAGQIPFEDRDGGFMDTSEKWECYVFGQCEEYSVNFEKITSAESCHKFCGKNDDCKWWTWEPDNSLCSLFANCTEPKQSTGHPDAGPCSDCISGQQACPGRECHSPNKCQGHYVDSFEAGHLEDCINMCKDTVSCEWYTYDKKIDKCFMLKDCNTTISCDTCATGKKYCSNGYHGDDESVTEALDKTVTVQVEDPTWLCDIDWSQTYRLSTYKGKEVLLKNDFDLNSIWGPGTPGSGKDDGICEFIAVHCRDSYDGFGTDVICSKTYKWFSH